MVTKPMRRIPIAIASVCLLALAARLVGIYFFQEEPRGDTLWYHQTAIGLLDTGRYVNASDQALTAFRMPGYTLVLAGLYFVVGPSFVAGAVLNALLGVVNTLLVYCLARYFLSHRMALSCALLYALWPSMLVIYTPKLFVEVTHTLFILLAMIRCVILFRDVSLRNVLIFSLVVGLSLYFRPTLAFLPGIIILACILNRSGAARTAGLTASSVAVVLVALSPWVLRNLLVFNELVWLGTFGAYNLAVQAMEPTGYASSIAHYPPNASRDLPYVRYEFYWHEHGLSMWLDYVRHNFTEWLALRWKVVYFLWHRDVPRHFSSTLYSASALFPAWVAVQSHYLLVLGLAGLGFLASCWRMGSGWVARGVVADEWTLALLFLYWHGFHLALYGHPRHHTGMVPVIIILAVIGMVVLSRLVCCAVRARRAPKISDAR